MIPKPDHREPPLAVRLPLAFDAAPLDAYLDTLAGSDWTDHFVRQNYDGRWSVAPLRAPKGAVHPIMRITAPAGVEWEDTERLAASPFQTILAMLQCRIDSARLMRLGPGSRIHEHRDTHLDDAEGMLRLHLPIRTNPDVNFEVSRRRIVMPAGSLWYLRLSEPHRVANHGATERVHLVLDVARNAWIDELLASGDSLYATEKPPLS